MILQPIVEGFGDVDAVPALLRRFVHASGLYEIQVARAIRSHRVDLAREASLQKVIELARLRGAEGILITFDSDDDCPVDLARQIGIWAKKHANPLPCEIAIAQREYEAWFLGAIESLRGTRGISLDAMSEAAPETVRDAKSRLEKKMQPGTFYSERADQVALTAQLDLAQSYRTCRSFRRIANAFAQVSTASGLILEAWPPEQWLG
jgi:hypothetical protein